MLRVKRPLRDERTWLLLPIVALTLGGVAVAQPGNADPPPILLSAAWSTAAGISFSCSLAYLLLEPKRPQLLRLSVIPAASMLCALALLLLRNG